MMPLLLRSPSVGLMPTIPLADDGHTIEPSVSVPIAAAQRLAATAPPEPELEPHGLRSRTYGFFACPPRPLQPLVECVERKFAHSLRFALPRKTAPAARSLAAMKASCGAIDPSRARDPAVVVILSAVSMLSLSRIGIPCNGPRTRPAFLSRSRDDAMDNASGFTSITWCSDGPFRSTAAMRLR